MKGLVDWLRRHHRKLGLLLGLFGIVFVALQLGDDFSQIDWTSDARERLGVALASSAALLLVSALLGIAWWSLLKTRGLSVPVDWAIASFGSSQIGKYIPGNIFHLAGRQVISVGFGLPGKKVAFAQMQEIALLAVIAATYFALLLPFWLPDAPWALAWPAFLGAQVLLLLALLLSGWKWSIVAFLSYHLYFAACGYLFFILIDPHMGRAFAPGTFALIVAAFAVAWVAGLLAPGSPAGLGIREAVLIIALNGAVADSSVALATILLRIATIIGDVCLFLVSTLILSRRYRISTSPIEKQLPGKLED